MQHLTFPARCCPMSYQELSIEERATIQIGHTQGFRKKNWKRRQIYFLRRTPLLVSPLRRVTFSLLVQRESNQRESSDGLSNSDTHQQSRGSTIAHRCRQLTYPTNTRSRCHATSSKLGINRSGKSICRPASGNSTSRTNGSSR